MKGAEMIVQSLLAHGVDTVFAYPGGSILSLLDALCGKRGIKVYSCCHEQFCVHAAEGYARATGKPGVVIATSGPGATNLVTGLADAFMDSVPLIAITGNVPLSLLGRDAFQEIDIYGVSMPITKHNLIVKSADALAETMQHAFHTAMEGRKGPVLVDIPNNLFDETTPSRKLPPLPLTFPEPSQASLEKAAALLSKATHPLLCCGGGVIASEAASEVHALADRIGCPVATTAMGIGSYPQDDPRYLGLVGMELNEGTVNALAKTDLFVAAGIRFSERMLSNLEKYAPRCKILHLDIDEAEIDKNLRAYSSVVGDLKETLSKLIPLLPKKQGETYPFTEERDPLFTETFAQFPDAVFTTEVGLHQIAACHGLPIRSPRSFLTSGGLGTMGFGLPAAIGACIGTGKRVINFAGDGSFHMNMQELSTAVRYHLPILQIVLNNNGLGMIRRWQELRYDGRVHLADVPQIDAVAVAQAMGITHAIRTDRDGYAQALRSLKQTKQPALIEVML